MEEQKIIDFHAHIYPEKIASKAIENISRFYEVEMSDQIGTAEDLIEKGSASGVTNYVVSSVATSARQVKGINDFLAREIKLHPEFTAFGALHPDMNDAEIAEELDRMESLGIRGIKLHPDFQTFFPDENENAQSIFRRASGRFPVLFHAGDERYPYSTPKRIATVARKYPDLTVIAAHFGGYMHWSEIEVYGGLENLFFDTSSTLFRLSTEHAEEIISFLGAKRFLFGTDYPMFIHSEELKRFLKLDLTDEKRQMILYSNAAKLLGLS